MPRLPPVTIAILAFDVTWFSVSIFCTPDEIVLGQCISLDLLQALHPRLYGILKEILEQDEQ